VERRKEETGGMPSSSTRTCPSCLLPPSHLPIPASSHSPWALFFTSLMLHTSFPTLLCPALPASPSPLTWEEGGGERRKKKKKAAWITLTAISSLLSSSAFSPPPGRKEEEILGGRGRREVYNLNPPPAGLPAFTAALASRLRPPHGIASRNAPVRALSSLSCCIPPLSNMDKNMAGRRPGAQHARGAGRTRSGAHKRSCGTKQRILRAAGWRQRMGSAHATARSRPPTAASPRI